MEVSLLNLSRQLPDLPLFPRVLILLAVGGDGAGQDLEVPFLAQAVVTAWPQISTYCFVGMTCSRNMIEPVREAVTQTHIISKV